MNMKKWIGQNAWVWSILGSFVLWIVISMMTNGFSLKMLMTNATLASFLMLLTLGQMTVITSGNGAIDLSIQYTTALSAYLSSSLVSRLGLFAGLGLTLLICVLVGVANGVVNMYLRVPAMITTLAVGYIVYSSVLKISSMTTGMPAEQIAFFTQRFKFGSFSPLILVSLAFAGLTGLLLYKTRFGKQLHAVGQNRNAANLAGIHVVKVVMGAFIISSVLAGIAGTLLGGYFGGASQDMGLSYLMSSVAAAVIGGTVASGGKSSVAGAVLGSLFLTLITAFLNLTRLPMSFQNIIQGSLLMLILIASMPKSKRRTV